MHIPGVAADGTLTPGTRLVARIASALAFVTAAILVVLAVVPLRTGGDTRLPVVPGRAVDLPSPGFLGRTMVLVGRDPGDRLPDEGDLGCQVTDARGRDPGGVKLSVLGALGAADRDVDGRVLTPLAEVDGFGDGWQLTCTGPAATSLQPLYLLDSTERAVPRAVAIGFAFTSFVAAVVFWAVGRGTTALGASRTEGRARSVSGG